MNSLRQIRLVAVRDFVERVTSKAFLLSTAVTLVLVAGIVVAPTFLDDDAPTWTIGVVGMAPDGLAERVGALTDKATTVDLRPLADRAAAEEAILDGDVVAAIVEGELIASRDADGSAVSTLRLAIGSIRVSERAAALGVSPEVLGELLAAASPEVVAVEDPSDDGDDANRTFAVFVTIFLFISIVTYGQWILIGVIEEKSNRVVEVVLGAIRPHHLLAGKILGIGALGLAQVVLLAGLALGLVDAVGTFELPPAAIPVAIAGAVWFVLGFVFYAAAYAAAGSLVNRQEEAQNAAFPLTLVLLVAYFIATFSFTGDNPALQAASLLPPFAPLTMPIRMAGGDAAVWEVVVSFGGMLAGTYLLVRLAGRIYRGGLLRTGRTRLREAWRAAEA